MSIRTVGELKSLLSEMDDDWDVYLLIVEKFDGSNSHAFMIVSPDNEDESKDIKLEIGVNIADESEVIDLK